MSIVRELDTTEYVLIDEGIYQAEVTKVEEYLLATDKFNHPEKIRIYFYIPEQDNTISYMVNDVFTTKSKLFKVVSTLLGTDDPDVLAKVDFEKALVGRAATIGVEHVVKDENTYARITMIAKPSKMTKMG
jgi:hypothetical protein